MLLFLLGGPMTQRTPDEQAVEAGLREILDPLDRQLSSVSSLLPLAVVTVAPLVFFVLWLALDQSGRRSLALSVGAVFALVACYLTWEMLVARMARVRFDRRFPPGSPQRALAMQMLVEMETPSKAEDKLRLALDRASPDRIVRRRPVEGVVENQQTLTEAYPETQLFPTEPTAATPEHFQSEPRSGGYYDYIPLEPRRVDDQPGERKG